MLRRRVALRKRTVHISLALERLRSLWPRSCRAKWISWWQLRRAFSLRSSATIRVELANVHFVSDGVDGSITVPTPSVSLRGTVASDTDSGAQTVSVEDDFEPIVLSQPHGGPEAGPGSASPGAG